MTKMKKASKSQKKLRVLSQSLNVIESNPVANARPLPVLMFDDKHGVFVINLTRLPCVGDEIDTISAHYKVVKVSHAELSGMGEPLQGVIGYIHVLAETEGENN
jgi:hypothetical protein